MSFPPSTPLLAAMFFGAAACGAQVVFDPTGGSDGSGATQQTGGNGGGCGSACTESEQCCCGLCISLDLLCNQRCDTCVGPYHLESPDTGFCVWSCGEGTTPDNASQECVCMPGLVESGEDQFGRRICDFGKD